VSIIASTVTVGEEYPKLAKQAKGVAAQALVVEQYSNHELGDGKHYGCNDGIGAHCGHYMFDVKNAEGGCGFDRVHTQNSETCEALPRFGVMLDNLANNVEAAHHADDAVPNNVEDIAGFLEFLRYQAATYRHYIGHKIRLKNESLRIARLEEECKIDHKKVIIVADFAMKWLPAEYRETMNAFFGGKGKLIK
jgi:hypothetical protein